jgi:L-ascorbate metabolism protein UlaG (beta-lactamase superfamily)
MLAVMTPATPLRAGGTRAAMRSSNASASTASVDSRVARAAATSGSATTCSAMAAKRSESDSVRFDHTASVLASSPTTASTPRVPTANRPIRDPCVVAIGFYRDTAMPTDRFLVRWIGHATVVLTNGEGTLLTDPALTRQLAHLRRRTPLSDLPGRIDGVLLSHLHMDHLHLPSLRRVAAGVEVVVPRGGEPLVRSLDAATIHSVVPGDSLRIAGFDIDVVYADHLHGRGPHSRLTAQPVGFVIRHGGRSVYFGGDTDLFPAMAELAPIDVALVPIWGWGPTLGERHLDPTSAARATQLIDPAVVIPIHWGTYSPVRALPGSPAWLERPLARFRDELHALGLADRLVALEPGGTHQVATSAV